MTTTADDPVTFVLKLGRATPVEGSRRIDAIEAAAPPWGTVTTIAASALASAAGTRLLGGGAREILAAVAVGLLLGLFFTVVSRRLPTLDLSEFVGGLAGAGLVAAMVVTAVALAAGLLLSNVLLPPRRA